MVFFVANILVALLGVLSVLFGLIGVGVMNWFWRILHVLMGAAIVYCVAPYLITQINKLLPPDRRPPRR